MADPREEALERAKRAQRQLLEAQGTFVPAPASGDSPVRTVAGMRDQFVDRWFSGGDAFDSPELNIHDAAHQYVNISPSQRGEGQQTIADLQGTNELISRTGATGFVNSTNKSLPEDRLNAVIENSKNRYNRLRSDLHPDTGGLGDRFWKDVWSATEDINEVNSPERKYKPPITDSEVVELRRRGSEFYNQVADRWQGQTVLPGVGARETFVQGVGNVPVSPLGEAIHSNLDKIQVRGGYDKPGALPFGPIMQNVQYPVNPGIDVASYRQEAAKRAASYLDGFDESPMINAEDEFDKIFAREEVVNDFMSRANKARNTFGTPDGNVNAYIYSGPGSVDLKSSQLSDIEKWKQEFKPGTRTPLLTVPRSAEAGEILANLHDRDRVAGSVGRGYRAAGNALSALPLADPEFQEAVDKRQGGRAAAIAARDAGIQAAGQYGTGAAAGVLQRTAPAIARQVLPAVTAAGNVAGALTWATLAPGSAPQPRRVGSYRGAPVWERGDGTMVADPGAGLGGPTRVGRARLNGREVFVPWGSAAGTSVGPRIVGRPWWDGGVQRAADSLQRQGQRAVQNATSTAAGGHRMASDAINRALGVPRGVPNAGNELLYMFNQFRQGRLPYQGSSRR